MDHLSLSLEQRSSFKTFPSPIISTDANPEHPFIYIGLATGQIIGQKISVDQDKPAFTAIQAYDSIHSDSCRGVSVSSDGKTLFSVSANRSIAWTDLETGNTRMTIPDAHSVPLQSGSYITPQLVASGDDDGILKIWDERALGKNRSPVMKFHNHIDFISSIVSLPAKKTIITGGGDGLLFVYDLRKNKCRASCDPLDEEILCLSFVKGGKKLLCGMQDGSINIFTWDYWAGPSDRLLGHPSSIDAMVQLQDSIVVTGSGDGFLRYVQVHPNKLLGWHAIPHDSVTGSRDGMSSLEIDSDKDFWPISTLAAMKISNEGPLLICSSQEILCATNAHIPFIQPAAQDLKSDKEELQGPEVLDIGNISDSTSKSRKKSRKFGSQFNEQHKIQRASFFDDLVESEDIHNAELDLVNN